MVENLTAMCEAWVSGSSSLQIKKGGKERWEEGREKREREKLNENSLVFS